MSARGALHGLGHWAPRRGVTTPHASSSFGGRSCVLHSLFSTTQDTTKHRVAPAYLSTLMQTISLDVDKCGIQHAAIMKGNANSVCSYIACGCKTCMQHAAPERAASTTITFESADSLARNLTCMGCCAQRAAAGHAPGGGGEPAARRLCGLGARAHAAHLDRRLPRLPVQARRRALVHGGSAGSVTNGGVCGRQSHSTAHEFWVPRYLITERVLEDVISTRPYRSATAHCNARMSKLLPTASTPIMLKVWKLGYEGWHFCAGCRTGLGAWRRSRARKCRRRRAASRRCCARRARRASWSSWPWAARTRASTSGTSRAPAARRSSSTSSRCGLALGACDRRPV